MKLHSLVFATAVLSACFAGGQASAGGLTLAGFELYPTNGSGNVTSIGTYIFSDNSNASFATQTITPTSPAGAPQLVAPAIPLSQGVDKFAFTSPNAYNASNSSNFGIGLLFTSNGTSLNPSVGSAPPELSAFASYGAGSTLLGNPVVGNLVADYSSSAGGAGVPYSGAHFFTVGLQKIYVTELSANGASGTFQLLVTPEPSSFILGGLGALGLFIAARRRRKA